MTAVRVYLALMVASLQAQLSYRSSFALEVLGRFATTGIEVFAVVVLFGHVEELGGWSRAEVLYLYGTASLSLGIAELLTDGLREMPDLVRMGLLDGLLVRPAPVLVQVLGRQCRPLHFGRILQGGLALIGGIALLDAPLGPLALAMLAVQITASTVVFAAIFVANAATCVFTVQSAEAFNAFTYGGVQMSQYPLPVYRSWIRTLYLWVVPVGFVSYFPALIVLGKEDVLGMPAAMPWLAPLVAVGFFAACLGWWSFAVRRYRSTGS